MKNEVNQIFPCGAPLNSSKRCPRHGAPSACEAAVKASAQQEREGAEKKPQKEEKPDVEAWSGPEIVTEKKKQGTIPADSSKK